MSASRWIRFFSRRRHQVKSQESNVVDQQQQHPKEKFFAELRQPSSIKPTFVCTVVFLDGEQVNFELDVSRTLRMSKKRFFLFQKKSDGKVLYEKVNAYLKLIETDYFAAGNSSTSATSNSGWNRRNRSRSNAKVTSRQGREKSIRSFLRSVGPPFTFRFRVKFYSTDPQNLHEELTR